MPSAVSAGATPITSLSQVGTINIDFGDIPTAEGQVDVTGQTSILTTSHVRVWIQGASMSNNDEMEHLQAGAAIRFTASAPVAGVGFTIKAVSRFGLVTGKFRLQWSWQ